MDAIGTEVLSDQAYWRPVGDQSSNAGAIEASPDEINPLIERVVNGMEAVIELKWIQHTPTKLPPRTPKKAIETLFNIPNGEARLLTEEQARSLADQVQLVLRGDRDRPTVLVRDRGIGIHPNDFPESIVSLGQSDKGERPYLIGMYGQGGSSAFEKAEYTIIVSRHHPDLLDGRQDLAGWTIVRRHLATRVHRYSYLVDPDTREVPAFDGSVADAVGLPHGTHVAHVSYRNLGPFAVQQITNRAYFTLNYRLFDPLIPWTLTEERSMMPRASRTMRGVPYRLRQLPSTTGIGLLRGSGKGGETSIRHYVAFDYRDQTFDTIRIEWWVLQDEAVQEGRRRGQHRRSANPYRDPQRRYSRRRVAITRGGQTHAALTPRIFEKQRLRQVARSIVLHVDTDGLSFEAGASFFASNRADLKTESQEAIERAITTAIDTYRDELRAIERERQTEIVQGRGAADEDAIRVRLDPMIRAFSRSSMGGRSGSTEKSGRQQQFTGRAIPTYLRFANQTELGLKPGVPRRADLLTDASDATMGDRRTKLLVYSDSTAFNARISGGGRGRWRVEVQTPAHSPTGIRGELNAHVESPGIWLVQCERPRPLVVQPPDPPYEGSNPPTIFRLRSRDGVVRVRQGGARVGIETDAVDEIFEHANLSFTTPDLIAYKGHGNPRKGEIRVSLAVPEDASIGVVGRIEAQLVLADGTSFVDSAYLRVDEKPESGGGFGSAIFPNYKIIDVRQFPANESERRWDDMPDILSTDTIWSGEDVAAFMVNDSTDGNGDERELVFYLNADNSELREAERRMTERRSDTIVEAVRQHHRALLCYHMYLMALIETQGSERDAIDLTWHSEGVDFASYERYREEMRRTNTTLLYAQRDFADLLEDDSGEDDE